MSRQPLKKIKIYKERLENKSSKDVYDLSGGDPEKIELLEEELDTDLDEIKSLYERLGLPLKEFYQWSYRLKRIQPTKVYMTYDKPYYFANEYIRREFGDEFAPGDLFAFLLGESKNNYFSLLDFDAYWDSQYERHAEINRNIESWLGPFPDDEQDQLEYEQEAYQVFLRTPITTIDIGFLKPVKFNNQKEGVVYLKDSFDYWYIENADKYTAEELFIFTSIDLSRYTPFGQINWKESRLKS